MAKRNDTVTLIKNECTVSAAAPRPSIDGVTEDCLLHWHNALIFTLKNLLHTLVVIYGNSCPRSIMLKITHYSVLGSYTVLSHPSYLMKLKPSQYFSTGKREVSTFIFILLYS